MEINDSIEEAFKSMGDIYHNMLCDKQIALTRDNIGFTERNLTFYFCSEYRGKNKDAIIWQELPIFDSHQHLDSIVMDKDEKNDTIDIYYIEAKRIYNKNYVIRPGSNSHGSLDDDHKRLRGLFSEEQFVKKIPGLYDFQKGCTTVRHHIVLLASLEHKPKEKPNTYSDRVNAIHDFAKDRGMQMLHYNVKDGYGIAENYSKDELMYPHGGNGQETLSFVNLDLYLMIEDVKHC
mgnify:CR=1 FL=1